MWLGPAAYSGTVDPLEGHLIAGKIGQDQPKGPLELRRASGSRFLAMILMIPTTLRGCILSSQVTGARSPGVCEGSHDYAEYLPCQLRGGGSCLELGTASLLPLWEPYLEPEPRASVMPGPSPAPPTYPHATMLALVLSRGSCNLFYLKKAQD